MTNQDSDDRHVDFHQLKAFDPLSYENLGESLSLALDKRPLMPLSDVPRFNGAGIYALYYAGDFPAYQPLARVNRQSPGSWAIYIGKAEAANERKGDPDQQNILEGPKLFGRIQKHKQTISAARNLNINDFQVRALVVAPAWVPLAEIISIRSHTPVWNTVIDGLGNNDPGAGRREGKRPRWDTIHPGRAWAELLQANESSAELLIQEALTFLTQRER